MDKKQIFPHIEWCIGKCPGLCTVFLKKLTHHHAHGTMFMLYQAAI